MKNNSRRLVAAALALAAACANAQIYGLLKDAPSSYFNDVDMQLFQEAATKALESGAVNQTITWQNPKTRHHGDITVLREFESKQRPCKQVRVRNDANGVKSDVRLDVCTIEGKWKIVSQSQR
jgi:surface antigen